MIKDLTISSYTLYEMANTSELRSATDKDISDIYHAIEFGSPNAIEITKLYKRLQMALRLRRRQKNLEHFLNGGGGQRHLKNMVKTQEHWGQKAKDFINQL